MSKADEQRTLQTAFSHHQRGALGEAAQLYRDIIKRNPNAHHALHFLGLIEADAGKFELAKSLMARSLSIQPPNVQFVENYATALYKSGDHQAALAACRDGLKLKRDSGPLLYLAALSLFRLGRLQESLDHFDRLLKLQPHHVAALNERGSALAALRAFEPALASVETALAINPNFAEAHLNKGNLCGMLRRYDEALAAYRQALTLNPTLAQAWLGRGNVFRDSSRLEEAVADYDKALALAPGHAEALGEKGRALLELGRFAEADQAIEKAIALAPRNASFYHALASSKRLAPGDPHLKAMEQLAEDMASLGGEDQIYLNFALAKAYGGLADHERSFQRLIAGNALLRGRTPYDEAATLGLLERTRKAFTAASMRGGDRGDPSTLPVFILGMPRSGTTLVEQILASHSQVFGAGEITDFHQAVAELGDGVDGPLNSPEAAAALSDRQLRELGAAYVARIAARAPAAARIANKTTENFRLAGLIHLALPNARIIHLRRDPVDTCLSCFSQIFGDNLGYTFDLGELGRYYRAYEATMAHWREVLPEGVMLEVAYEELVADLEPQSRRLLAHCGLEWEPQCLDFHQTVRPVRTASTVQVRQPIYKTSVGRWRAYESFLGPLLAELGPLS